MINMDIIEKDWKYVDMEQASDETIIDFLRMNCSFSIDVNTKDPLVKDWIYKNKHLIKSGKE